MRPDPRGPIRPGDEVRWVTGGPAMTVREIDGRLARVHWVADGIPHEAYTPLVGLVRADRQPQENR